MKWIWILLLCLTASAQLPVIPFNPTSTGRWAPTNATTGKLVWWGELTPIQGTYTNNVGAPILALDGDQVKIWTNFAAGLNGVGASQWTADQTLHPTNFVSGGGGNGTSRRVLFTAATSTRMVGGNVWPDTTNKATFVIVANCTATSGIDNIFINGGSDPFLDYNAKKLEMSQGTTITSAATMTTGYYVITAVFAAGASSHIDTNGVQMVSGNAGTDNMASVYLAQFNSPCYHGNISRFWAWEGVLDATDLANAVAQCKTDFGIQ